MSDNRTPDFHKNMNLERLLHELGNDLENSEKALEEKYLGCNQNYPLILIMGPLRSGTTLFMQWLANSGLFAYPTNLLSRFYHAPILGAKIQLLLTDPRYKFRDELGDLHKTTEFISENGKTNGVLAPNEFWYFWRQYFVDPTRDVWSNVELEQSLDVRSLRAALIGMMDVFNKPFVAKGMLFNYNIPFLDSIFEKILFIQLKRSPETNVKSVLEARTRQMGSESAWYSFKIREYEELIELDSVSQVAGQVHYINRAVDQGLSSVQDRRKLVVQYEDFCRNPSLIYKQLREKLIDQEYYIPSDYTGVPSFGNTRKEVKDPLIMKALELF